MKTMKPDPNGVSHRLQSYYLLILLLTCALSANAQVKKSTAIPKAVTPAVTTPAKTTTPVVTSKAITELPAPLAHNMDDYRKLPQYSKRVANLSKSFKDPAIKVLKFQDNTKDSIRISTKIPQNMVSGASQKTHGKPKKTSSGGYDCTTTNISISSNSSDYTVNDYSNTAGNIFPGACYTYDNINSGKWQPQPGTRNTIQISTNITDVKGKTYVYVKDPNSGTIGTGVAQLVSRFGNSSANEGTSFQTTLATNSATYNLSIGAGVSGYGVDLSNVYSTGSQSNHVHLTITAIKPLFTLSTTPPDSGFYKDPNVEATTDLSFISSVSYGVRILANADITFDSEQDADVFKGSYSGFGISANLNVNYSSSSKNTSTTINGYFVGGPSSGTFVATSLAQLQKMINDVFSKTTYKDALPISYTVCTMAGETLNTYNATDNFNEQTCTPVDGGSVQLQDASVTFTQGSDGKEAYTYYYLRLFPGLTPNMTSQTEPMYTAAPGLNTQYNNNGTVTVQLTRNPNYKGNFDEEVFQKAGGGTLVIGPLNNSANGQGLDIWDITQITLKINPKVTTLNTNPLALGPNKGAGMQWNLNGANQVALNSANHNVSSCFFDANFNPSGNQ
jgi:hypothetical protein